MFIIKAVFLLDKMDGYDPIDFAGDCMGNKKVLVVDDESSVRWALSEMLKGWGYDPLESENAEKARKIVESERPVAVLLDINLPDGSGLDLLSRIKHINPKTFTIMITADSTVENVVGALRRGADDFLTKPVNIAELQFALRSGIRANQGGADDSKNIKPRILIVADSEGSLDSMIRLLDIFAVELTGISSLAQLRRACHEVHDLTLVDVHPGLVNQTLAELRASRTHSDIPILVNNERLVNEISLAGVLPKYRAMACNRKEMTELIGRRANPRSDNRQQKPLL